MGADTSRQSVNVIFNFVAIILPIYIILIIPIPFANRSTFLIRKPFLIDTPIRHLVPEAQKSFIVGGRKPLPSREDRTQKFMLEVTK